MKKQLLLTILGSFILGVSLAQVNCSHVLRQEAYWNANPEWREKAEENRKQLEDFTQSFNQSSARESNECRFIIPVVFHILHDNGPENITDEQVHNAIKLLNQNFNGLNPDTVSVIQEFKSIVGNAKIEFRLAALDPNGNPSTGITRDQFAGGTQPNIQGIQWPRSMYMNVYTAEDLGQGIGGFTYLPGSVGAMDDAIYVLYNTLTGTTLSHEVGHWLNLMHPWGFSNDPGVQSNCNMDDQVQDTPLTVGWTTCNLNGTSCGSLDNVQNYMEYSFCTNMFTQGQSDRMIAALSSTIADRNNLWAPSNLAATGVDQLTKVDFSSDFTIICKNNYVQYYDQSTYGQCNWDWDFPGGNPSTSTDKYPKSFYDTPGSYDVTLVVTDNVSPKLEYKAGYVYVADPVSKYLPIQEGFETMGTLISEWGIINPDNDNVKWSLSNSAAATGSVSAYLNNFDNTTDAIDELISPGVDLSPFNSASLEFKYAFANKTANDDDKLILRVSTDCGSSWDLVWVGASSVLTTAPNQTTSFTPTSSEWVTKNISIPVPYLDEGFIYKFEFRSGGGNNVYLDDININGTYKDIPILYQPSNQSTVYSTDVTIDWKAMGGVISYEYEVSLDPNFSLIIATGIKAYISADPLGPDTEELIPGLSLGQKYYWRVRGVKSNGLTNWSSVWEFEPAQQPTSIGQPIDISDFKIYPNPTSGLVSISSEDLKDYDNVIVRNSIGQIVMTERLRDESNINLNLGNFDKGLYFVQFSDEKAMLSEIFKVVLQ
jgi:PKD repeat protein